MTLAAAPTPPAAARRAGGWRWAVGTLLAVSVILGATLAGQRYVAARRLAAAHVPDPRDPPIAALALARPAGLVAAVTPFAGGRRLVMLAGPPAPTCAPNVSCERPPTYDGLLALATATGATLWQAPLDGRRQHATALVVDDQRGLVDVISQDGVAVFDAATGAPRAAFALPHGATTSARNAAAFSGDGAVTLTAEEAGAPVLLAFDALTGAARFDRALPAQGMSQGPVIAAGDGVALVLTAIPGETLLSAYATADGTPRASVAVPAGTRLGPFDAARGRLYLFGPSGAVATLAPADLLAAGPASLAAPPAATLAAVPSLRGAGALGWSAALGHRYTVDAAGVRVLDGATGKTLAALPLGA
ncbi:MAG TPA: PQQ-binding-like beta-propeller repeat protein, partial [Ktedonobacterales bacterium]